MTKQYLRNNPLLFKFNVVERKKFSELSQCELLSSIHSIQIRLLSGGVFASFISIKTAKGDERKKFSHLFLISFHLLCDKKFFLSIASCCFFPSSSVTQGAKKNKLKKQGTFSN